MCLILLMAEDRVDGVYLYSFVIRTRTPRHDHLYTNTGIHVVSCPAAHYQTWNIRCFHHKQHSTCFLFFAWQMTNIVTVSTCPPSSGSKYPRQKTKYDVGTYCDFTCLKELAHEDLAIIIFFKGEKKGMFFNFRYDFSSALIFALVLSKYANLRLTVVV